MHLMTKHGIVSLVQTHSFNTERMLLRALADAGLLTFCSYIPGSSKHNRRCGMQKTPRIAKQQGGVQTDSFQEFDLAKELKPRKEKIYD